MVLIAYFRIRVIVIFMISPETSSSTYDSANSAISNVAAENSFDTFVHFQRLAEFGRDEKISAEDWEILLGEWQYDPSSFLAANARGNCVDFAMHSQDALLCQNIDSSVIGKKPDDSFTDAQKESMIFRHTSLVATLDDEPTMFEPGWKLQQGIPLLPIDREVDTGTWKFTTTDFTKDGLEQSTVSPLGKSGHRSFDFDSIDKFKAASITKGLLRVPRRMEMLTRFDDDIPHGIISYNPHTDVLKSTLEEMKGEPFTPESISAVTNDVISEYFGFDVKEQLLGCFALYRSLPPSFWVK